MIMTKRRIPLHPMQGDSGLLAGTRDVLGDRYRDQIERNYELGQRYRQHELTKVLNPGFAQDDTEWQIKAACRGADPDLFFPETNEEKSAKAWEPYCLACPVMQECKAFAEREGMWGIWGNDAHRISVTPQGRRPMFFEPGSAAHRRQLRDRKRREEVLSNG